MHVFVWFVTIPKWSRSPHRHRMLEQDLKKNGLTWDCKVGLFLIWYKRDRPTKCLYLLLLIKYPLRMHLLKNSKRRSLAPFASLHCPFLLPVGPRWIVPISYLTSVFFFLGLSVWLLDIYLRYRIRCFPPCTYRSNFLTCFLLVLELYLTSYP